MKLSRSKRFAAFTLAATMSLSLAACQNTGSGTDGTTAGSAAESSTNTESNAAGDNGKLTSITIYPKDANLTSGVVGGYMGEFFASKGLSVEVWAYSDEKTNAILASGDLPDIMYIDQERLNTMIDSDMILQLDEHLDQMSHVVEQSALLDPAFNYIREYRSNNTGKVYAMPTSVGPTAPDGSTDRNAVKLKWDIYEEIGAPEIHSYDDLIDVMAQMMAAHPTDEDTGAKIYGTVLNNGSDTTYWGNIILWMRWNGYSETNLPYLLEANMIEGELSSILDKDSMYYQGLQYYYKVMQAGVMNPDSINIDRSAAGQMVKMASGGTQPGWHDKYFEYLLPDTKVYFNPLTVYGDSSFGTTNNYIVVNSRTENLDAVLQMLDILADPDAQILKTMGPEGDYYEITDDGHLYLTDKAKEHIASGESEYYYDSGEKATMWNTAYILNSGAATSYLGYDEKPVPSQHTGWNEEMELKSHTNTYNMWKKTMGYDSWYDLLEDHDAWITSSPLDGAEPFLNDPDDTMQLTIDSIRDKVVEASWKMVYAENEQEFEAIWDKMVGDCQGLGAQDVIDWRLNDIEHAKKIRDSLK